MRLWLAILLALPIPLMSGCTGQKEVPALTEPGKDPPAEQQKNWMDESRNRGGAPKNSKPKPAEPMK